MFLSLAIVSAKWIRDFCDNLIAFPIENTSFKEGLAYGNAQQDEGVLLLSIPVGFLFTIMIGFLVPISP